MKSHSFKKEEPGSFQLKASYLAVIRNSINSNTYRNLYVKIQGARVDVLRDGDLSCAVYASSLLLMFELIAHPHTTVDGTIRDLKTSGWFPIQRPRVGAIVVWGPKTYRGSGETHKHIGFYMGKGRAISNSSKHRVPREHALRYRSSGIEQYLWHDALN